MRRVNHAQRCALLVLTAVLLSACTSSGSPGKSSSATSTPASTSVAPSTPAVSSSSTSSSATPTPTPTPTRTVVPLSPFEKDPGVQAFRAWAAAAARTVNTGHYISASLRATMTAGLASQMKTIIGTDVGTYYPGPVPYTPVRVIVHSSASREIDGCGLSTGFAENRKTHKPAEARKVIPVQVLAVQQSGRWVLSAMYGQARVRCTGVVIKTPRWSA